MFTNSQVIGTPFFTVKPSTVMQLSYHKNMQRNRRWKSHNLFDSLILFDGKLLVCLEKGAIVSLPNAMVVFNKSSVTGMLESAGTTDESLYFSLNALCNWRF